MRTTLSENLNFIEVVTNEEGAGDEGDDGEAVDDEDDENIEDLVHELEELIEKSEPGFYPLIRALYHAVSKIIKNHFFFDLFDP